MIEYTYKIIFGIYYDTMFGMSPIQVLSLIEDTKADVIENRTKRSSYLLAIRIARSNGRYRGEQITDKVR